MKFFKRRAAALALAGSLAMAAPVAINVAAAPPAHAAQYVSSMALVMNGQVGGILQVEYDGYSLAAYMFHKGTTLYQYRWTQVHFCYTWGNNGPCVDRPGYDANNYQGWAGPAVAWPSNAWDRNYQPWKARAWRAAGAIRDQWGHDWQVVMWANGGYDMQPDGWITSRRIT